MQCIRNSFAAAILLYTTVDSTRCSVTARPHHHCKMQESAQKCIVAKVDVGQKLAHFKKTTP